MGNFYNQIEEISTSDTLARPALIGNSVRPALIGNSARPALIGNSARPVLIGNSARPAQICNSARLAQIRNSARPTLICRSARLVQNCRLAQSTLKCYLYIWFRNGSPLHKKTYRLESTTKSAAVHFSASRAELSLANYFKCFFFYF